MTLTLKETLQKESLINEICPIQKALAKLESAVKRLEGNPGSEILRKRKHAKVWNLLSTLPEHVGALNIYDYKASRRASKTTWNKDDILIYLAKKQDELKELEDKDEEKKTA